MNIIPSILVNNDCYKAGKKITVKGLMLHSVGCSQPSAQVFIKQWNKSGVPKCVHAFLEADGDVYQTLPWNHRGWHSSSGKNGAAHNTHIGVEMCEPSTVKYTSDFGITDTNPEKTKEFVMGTYRTAVKLFSFLCKEYNLNPLGENVIISHHEGFKLGIASNHGDPEHLWKRFGLTMDQFRKDVKSAMESNVIKGSDEEMVMDKSFIQLKKITANVLNIREKPDAKSTDVGDLLKDEIITATGSVGKWLRISHNGKDAFISPDYCVDYIPPIIPDLKPELEKLKRENLELNGKINAVKNYIRLI